MRLGEWDLDHSYAIALSGHHAEFEPRIAGHIRFLGAREGKNTQSKRRSGTDRCRHVFRIEAFNPCKGLDQIVCQIVGVTPALRDDRGHRVFTRASYRFVEEI